MNPSAASFMKLVGVVLRVRFGVPIWRNLIVIALTAIQFKYVERKVQY